MTGPVSRLARRLPSPFWILGGVGLVIIGVLLHSHFGAESAVCGTGLGQLGQAVNPQAANACSAAASGSDLGLICIIGGIMITFGGISKTKQDRVARQALASRPSPAMPAFERGSTAGRSSPVVDSSTPSISDDDRGISLGDD